jgi:uncharacterized membrane-anchored protein
VGRRVARRLRITLFVLVVVLLVGGAGLFLFESQTFGRIALTLGLGGAVLWIGVRYIYRHNDDPLEAIQRWRWPLVALAALMVAAGWVLFFAVWEELGLLIVLFGALPLLLLTAGVSYRPLTSPIDEPPYGDTGPS